MHGHLLLLLISDSPIHGFVLIISSKGGTGIDHHSFSNGWFRIDDDGTCGIVKIFAIHRLLFRDLGFVAGKDLVYLEQVNSVLLVETDIAVAHQVDLEILFTLEVLGQKNDEVLLRESLEGDSLEAEKLPGD